MAGIPLFLFLFIFLSPLWSKTLDVATSSDHVILINAKDGAILYEKNPNQKTFPASTTKIATALYALTLKGKELDATFTASQNAIATITPQAKRQSNFRAPAYLNETDGTHMSIKRGEEISFYELLCGMLIASANDAANVVAENIGGSIPEFMEGLNKYLKQIGCLNTHFCNPHGLYHPEHQTSAYDMALISQKAMEIPVFREIVSKATHTIPKTNFEYERKLMNTNALIRKGPRFYAKAIGIKTGYTSQAGKNLVAGAEDSERTLIAVVLAAPSIQERFDDAVRLFEAAFTEKKMRQHLFSAGEGVFKRKVPHGKKELVAFLPEGLYYDFYPSEKKSVKARISWNIPPLPIEKGASVGFAKIFDDKGLEIKKTLLVAKERVEPTLRYRFAQLIKERKKALFFVTSGFFILFVILSLRRRSSRKSSRRPLF